MSEPDDMPDPIDEAYVKAEALLRDEAARAARRGRVLAAMETEAAAPERPVSRPSIWRRGGWLAAACVAGLSLIVVSQIYRPPPKLPAVAPATAPPPASKAAPAAAPAVPAAPREGRASGKPPAGAGADASETANAPTVPAQLEQRQREAAPLAEQPGGVLDNQAAPAPPAAQRAPAPRAFRGEPAAAPPPPPPPAPLVAAPRPAAPLPPASDASSAAGKAADNVGEIVVTRERDTSRRGRSGGFAAPADEPLAKSEAGAATRAELGARLRAAAAAGSTAELDALLRQGAPVDAVDAAGDTALMLSLRADHAGAAAALRRHGASLERRNHAGESARDIAAARADPELARAIGTAP